MRALLMGLIILGAAPAWAEDVEQVERAHFAAGQALYKVARFAEALREFQEAYRVGHRAAFLYNVGVCYERLGQLDQAIELYTDYLRLVEDAPDRAAIQAHIVDLHQQRALKPTLTVVAIEPAVTRAPPRRDRRRNWVWGVVAGVGAVVVAGVVVGAVLGTQSSEPASLPSVNLR